MRPAKTILLVDDDPPTQQLLKALMRRSGFASVAATNGREAIEILQTRSFDAILLDLMMPAVDGRGVLEFLATDQRGIPVIVCTAAGPRATEHVKGDMVRAIVRKPFDIEQLMATIVSVTE
jgi:CheY-like chemotaxis protein